MKLTKLICIILIFLHVMSCNKEEENAYGINQTESLDVKAMVVDTQNGWMLLTQMYGFLDLIEPLNDSLKVDALQVTASIYKGRTYLDNDENSTDPNYFNREFTFAKLINAKLSPQLFKGPNPPFINIIWSPDFSDDTVNYPDGYGYIVKATTEGFEIAQYEFPETSGLGTFKTEVEAQKMGMYTLHRISVSANLPDVGQEDMDFLKVDWY